VSHLIDPIKRLHGFYRAVVVDNNDPNNLRRLKVQVQTTGPEVTDWIWPVNATAKPPAIGQGVYVTYLGGDPEYPIWVGTFGKGSTATGTGEGGGNNPPAGFLSYGAFHDETTQSAALNTATAIKFGKTDLSSGVSVANQTQLTPAYDGVYNVQFSLQLHKLSGGGSGDTVQIWLDKNGTAVPQSNTLVTVNSNNPYVVSAWNFLVYLKAHQYCRIMWATNNTQIKIEASTATPGPAVPSTIVTVTQVA
jgi:hypothetical protein